MTKHEITKNYKAFNGLEDCPVLCEGDLLAINWGQQLVKDAILGNLCSENELKKAIELLDRHNKQRKAYVEKHITTDNKVCAGLDLVLKHAKLTSLCVVRKNELLEEINKYTGVYKFSFQFWGPHNNNVFIMKDDVDIYDSGGHATTEEALTSALHFIYKVLRVHKKNRIC